MTLFQSLLNDVKLFLADLRWERPSLILVGLIPIVLSLILWLLRKRHQNRIARLGKPAAIEALIVNRVAYPRWSKWLLSLAWISLSIALAGPRWGVSQTESVAIGRDIVLILDFSRSMLADDSVNGKARWQLMVDSAVDLVDQLQPRGGHRLSVVLFAARTKTLVPLTTDYNHIRTKIKELNGQFPPPDIRPDRDDAISGTRIGASIKLAIENFDPRFSRARDLILFSDGDDPATDREWTTGISAARQALVPIHCVGFGDPDQSSLIPVRKAPLEYEEKNGISDVVRTRLHEDVLKQMANETRGEYLPARRTVASWPVFIRQQIDETSQRELIEDPLPQKKPQARWFYLAGLIFVLLSWWFGRSRIGK